LGTPESAPASAAAAFGTQGKPLQQSALETHAAPAFAHCEFVQRGTPTLSGLHVFWWQLPLQQSHEAVHPMLPRRQTSPFGLQESGLRQMPSTFGGVTVHAPGWL